MRDMIVTEAYSWLGTPYHHHGRVKGAGVDCAQLLIGVFENCQIVQDVDPGNYAPDWHMHRSEEVYIDWMDRYGERTDTPGAGDVALFRFGRTYSHSGIIVPEGVIHSYVGRGVVLTRLDEEPLAGRPVLFWKMK